MTPGMMSLMATAHLDDGDAEAVLRNFATRHGIRRLALFGSVLRGEETRPATSTCWWSSRRVGRPDCSASQSWSWSSARCWGGRSSCGPMRISAGTSGTTSGHGRVCSMPPDDEVRVCHLVEAANKAVTYAAGRSRDDLDRDELLRLALTKLVESVGEAARRKLRPESDDDHVDVGASTASRHACTGFWSWVAKYAMSAMASPARDTACSATATNDRSAGSRRSSEVWLRNTRRGHADAPRSTALTGYRHYYGVKRLSLRSSGEFHVFETGDQLWPAAEPSSAGSAKRMTWVRMSVKSPGS